METKETLLSIAKKNDTPERASDLETITTIHVACYWPYAQVQKHQPQRDRSCKKASESMPSDRHKISQCLHSIDRQTHPDINNQTLAINVAGRCTRQKDYDVSDFLWRRHSSNLRDSINHNLQVGRLCEISSHHRSINPCRADCIHSDMVRSVVECYA